MSVTPVMISGRALSENSPAMLVAEIGLNHNGQPDLAMTMLRAAHDAGACVGKFQTFLAERLVSSKSEAYGDHAASGNPVEVYRTYELPPEAYPALVALGRDLGIGVASTPFDEETADRIAALGAPFLKIASGDLTHIPLLKHVGLLGLPIVLSTGMGTMEEIDAALGAIGHHDVILLQCTSSYPCAAEDVNLRAMIAMRERFKLPVGLSDHTQGIGAATAAVALGACMIEKHFTCDRSLPGPDQKMSLDPAAWREMTHAIRDAEASLGSPKKIVRSCETTTIRLARRSLVAARDLPQGHRLMRDDLAVKRPGTGLPPSMLESSLGRALARSVSRDEMLQADDLI